MFGTTPAETAAFFDRFVKRRSLETRSELYKRLGKYEAAIDDLTKVLESTKYRSLYLMRRGDLFVLTNQFTRALIDYESAKQLDQELRNIDQIIEETKRKMRESDGKPNRLELQPPP